MDIRKLFGANVRRYPSVLGISQAALAERMGVDRAHISLIERGMQNATLLTIWEASQALGVQPVVLLAPSPSDSEV